MVRKPDSSNVEHSCDFGRLDSRSDDGLLQEWAPMGRSYLSIEASRSFGYLVCTARIGGIWSPLRPDNVESPSLPLDSSRLCLHLRRFVLARCGSILRHFQSIGNLRKSLSFPSLVSRSLDYHTSELLRWSQQSQDTERRPCVAFLAFPLACHRWTTGLFSDIHPSS